ncbi:DUF5068 domain-containing protein [Paenibacillus sp. FJAT-26967]|uniref:DUF5068 domain-containing protein n=1 Tax=Paenibacillus sp. FJAT-26967 TaxID=1729690 RepID=UPI000838CDBB|nr:DUF5068 domain-containing protein [Paenibacillus sp. FJAT-26967]
MRKKQIIYSTLITAMLMASTACGNGNQAGEADSDKGAAQESSKPAASVSPSPAPSNTPAAGNKDTVLNPNIAEQSKGKVEVVYTNSKPGYTHDMNGFKVNIEEYQIVKVTGMSKEMAIPFNDQTDGYVVTAKVNMDNGTGKAMYYPTNKYRLQVTSSDFISADLNRTFVKKEDQLKSKVETEASKYGAGEKLTGYVTFTLTNDEFDALKKVKPKFVIEGGAADNKEFKGSFKGNATFDFIIGEDQKQEAEAYSKFYPDRLVTDNMADKKMIFEKAGMNETKQLSGVKVTIEGVQYTEITPTPDNKERFKNFGDNGIVALTVKIKLDNQSSENLLLNSIGSKVRIDENRGNVLSQGGVEPSAPSELAAGAQGEKLHVFLMRKDEFETFKKFELEFGPFRGKDGKDMFNKETVQFTLPR